MSDFEFHPTVLGADSTDLKANTLTRMGEAVVYGVPAAAASGALSIANSFISKPNEYNIEQTIRSFDDRMGDYYAEHKQAVDLVGFVGTSFIPGTVGIKALQAARGGTALGSVGKALNLTASKKTEYLNKALQETSAAGGTMKSIMSANRLRQAGWEVADQALLGTAAELAIAGTMNDSPVFDGNTVGDMAWNIGLGTVLSGGIGGALGTLTARGILKDAATAIQGQSRIVDTVFDPARIGLGKGTETLLFAESIAKLPEEFGNLQFKFRYDGKQMEQTLETAGALKTAKERAQELGAQKLALKFNELAEGNANVGQAYYSLIKEGIDAARAAGKTVDEQVDLISGYLNNVNKISAIDLEQVALDARKFYVRRTPLQGTAEDIVSGMFTKKRTAETSRQAYRLADEVTEADLTIAQFENLRAADLKTAWKLRPDLDAIRMPDGTMRINPSSKNVLRVTESPYTVRQFVDIETGTVMPEAAALFGDIVGSRGRWLQATQDSVQAGGQSFRQAAHVPFSLRTSPLQASARFAWASQLKISELQKVTGGVIKMDDFPVVDRLLELIDEGLSLDTVRKMKFQDGDVLNTFDEIVDLRKFAESKKLELMRGELDSWKQADGGVPSSQIVSAHVNSNLAWVEEAIDRGFKPAVSNEQTAGKLLQTVDSLKPRTVQVEWDFAAVKTMLPEDAYRMNMGPSHLASQTLSREYQLAIRSNINRNAANAVLGEDAALFMDAPADLARAATAEGAGATSLGASNASYGERAKLWVQDTGKNVALLSQRWRDAVVETLSPDINALRASKEASAEFGVLTTALRKSEYRYVFDATSPKRLVSTEAASLGERLPGGIDEALDNLAGTSKSPHSFDIDNLQVAEFLRSSTTINTNRQNKFTTLYNATGLTRKLSTQNVIYVPPINTVKYPFHAFVRTKEKIGVASDVTMIVARTEDELRTLAKQVGDDYDVLFKSDTANYFKAKGEYDYGLSINEATVNSDLARKGVLANMYPPTNLETVMEEWLQWHARQEEKLVRNAVQVGNRQVFSELEFLSENYRTVSESVFRGIGSSFKSKVSDPFGDYIKTALNISKQQEFPLLDSLNEFVDKLGYKAGEAFDAVRSKQVNGEYDIKKAAEEANKISKQYGLGTPYDLTNLDSFMISNAPGPRNLIREGFQLANSFLATATLRLDFANSLVSIISTPIMLGTELASIKGLIANDSVLAGRLRELTSVAVPGGNGMRVPSNTKLMANAINNFFGADKDALLARYKQIGSIKEGAQVYHDTIADLAFRSDISPVAWLNKVKDSVEKGAKLTGNSFSEELTRFVSADVMRQLSDPLVEAGKMTIKEQNAYMSTFVNRVQGNYVTSQRPIVFQGTTGAAVSLFQTFAFNVLQQLFRHMQAGDKKTLLTFAGLQSTVFGFNGLPFFDAVNTHLIGSLVANNPQHTDAYNVLPGFNKELGDWMLYGTASAFPLFSGSAPALFTRGDINPRYMTVLPTNPMDVPAVQGSLRLVGSLADMAKNLMPGSGVDTTEALLKGMEHQGISRPLAGVAQLLSGRSTTSKGALVSAASDVQTASWLGALSDRMITYGGVARLAGARPMDEALALNALYRQKAYDAMDKSRIERLGEVVKTQLYNNQPVDDADLEDFMLRYTRSGGRIENFSQSMQRWMKDANVSVVNQMAQKLGSPYSMKLQSIMGGEMLPDYRNQASQQVE